MYVSLASHERSMPNDHAWTRVLLNSFHQYNMYNNKFISHFVAFSKFSNCYVLQALRIEFTYRMDVCTMAPNSSFCCKINICLEDLNH